MVTSTNHLPVVIVDQGVIDGAPIRAISYLPPEHDWDSGFAVFSQDADADDPQDLARLRRLLPRGTP
jgi:hypothetical protein